nr:MAG TPA_asm: hypothetical protein [Caudoviricetes sp.]
MSTGARAGGDTNLVSHVNSAAMVHPGIKPASAFSKETRGYVRSACVVAQ